jgi:hypothetical protein
MKISEHFGFPTPQAELDFVDISPDIDIPCSSIRTHFLVRDDAWSEQCNNDVGSAVMMLEAPARRLQAPFAALRM